LRVFAGVCGEGEGAVAVDVAEAGRGVSVFGDGFGGVVFSGAGAQGDGGGAEADGRGLACGSGGVFDGCAAEPAFCDAVRCVSSGAVGSESAYGG